MSSSQLFKIKIVILYVYIAHEASLSRGFRITPCSDFLGSPDEIYQTIWEKMLHSAPLIQFKHLIYMIWALDAAYLE